MDGTSHTFTYPALKLLDYTVEKLEERGLSILLPFYLLKLRKRVQAARMPGMRRKMWMPGRSLRQTRRFPPAAGMQQTVSAPSYVPPIPSASCFPLPRPGLRSGCPISR
jgi:hypothetical protein